MVKEPINCFVEGRWDPQKASECCSVKQCEDKSSNFRVCSLIPCCMSLYTIRQIDYCKSIGKIND